MKPPMIGPHPGESGEPALSFGQCCVLPRSRQLMVNGTVVEIGGRAFDILLALIEANGSLITKDELQRRVWPSTHVEPSNIRVQISLLRKALAADRDAIKTVPGRGFLFGATLTSGAEKSEDRAETDDGAEPPAPAEPNLPKYISVLVGRDEELAKVRDNLANSRLVTIVGTGGIGKTRLAIETGWQLSADFAGGVRYVDLAPAFDAAAVVSVAAVALGISIKSVDIGVETIATTLADRKMLLIFDNCEHVVADAAALIAAILVRAADVTIMATSQEALNLAGERIFRLGSLALPPDGATDVGNFAAIALFLHRAQAVDCGITLDGRTSAIVTDICRRLDGIPLVLEMAAARLPLLGLEQLHAAIDTRFKLLTAGVRWAGRRHSTLLAMVEWSHSLLTPADQTLFYRLGVFSGSFSLEAAIAVAGEQGQESWETVDGLGRLLAKSFLQSEALGQQRFRLLESHRLYALERLSAGGGVRAVAERHARYYADLIGRAYDALEVTPDAVWLGTYQPESDNLRAALLWAFSPVGDGQIAVTLAGNAGRLWQMLGLAAEGRHHVDRALALLTEETPPAAAGRLLLQAAALHRMDQRKSFGYAERAAELYRRAGDALGLATVQSHMGVTLMFLGRFEEAEGHLATAYRALDKSDRQRSLCNALMNLGTVAAAMNRLPEALAAYRQALELARALKLTNQEYDLLHNSAEVEFYAGASDRAIEIVSGLVARLRRGDNLYAASSGNLAWFLLAENRLEEARPFAVRAMRNIMEVGGQALRALLLQSALIAALDDRNAEAARLLGNVEEANAQAGILWQPLEEQARLRLQTLLEGRLSPDELAALRAIGRDMGEAEAIELAIALTDAGRSIRPL